MGNQHTKYDEKIKNFTIEKELQDNEIIKMKQQIQLQQEKLDKMASDFDTLHSNLDIKITNTVNNKTSEDHEVFKVMIEEAVKPLEQQYMKIQEELKCLSKQTEAIKFITTSHEPKQSKNIFSCLMRRRG